MYNGKKSRILIVNRNLICIRNPFTEDVVSIGQDEINFRIKGITYIAKDQNTQIDIEVDFTDPNYHGDNDGNRYSGYLFKESYLILGWDHFLNRFIPGIGNYIVFCKNQKLKEPVFSLKVNKIKDCIDLYCNNKLLERFKSGPFMVQEHFINQLEFSLIRDIGLYRKSDDMLEAYESFFKSKTEVN